MQGKILVYHSVNSITRNNPMKVSFWKFFVDMWNLRNKEVVYLDEFDKNNPRHIVITFDDGYKNFLKYAFPILKFFNYKFELFVIGDFCLSQTLSERSKNRLKSMRQNDLINVVKTSKGRLQYHTWTHYNLEEINDGQLLESEIKLPDGIKNLDEKGFNWFAYPYGAWNDEIITIVKRYYKGARGCGKKFKDTNDENHNWALEGIIVDEKTKV